MSEPEIIRATRAALKRAYDSGDPTAFSLALEQHTRVVMGSIAERSAGARAVAGPDCEEGGPASVAGV
ncbi:hypothetical protein AB0F39_34490 [Streptomyces murinus]|uniref:hypothetical protein n=1 Tax=Streptomyces murinus TaxID=33900 RepID=UPI0033C567CD